MTGAITHTYDSGDVAAGAAIDSDVPEFGSAEAVTAYVNNAGAVTRALTVDLLADDGVTVLMTWAPTAVAAGAKCAFAIGYGATAKGAEGAAGSVGILTVGPTRKLRFRLAAGGAAVGRVTAIGR